MSQSHEVNTVADIVRFWAKQSPGNVALVCDNTTVSYGLLDARSSQAANRMLQAGVGRGSRIGYLGVNSTGFFDTWFGAGKIGCAFAPFNWRLSPTELVEIIDDAQPAIVFVDTGLSDKIEAVRARTSSQYEVVVFDTALNNGLQEWAGAASSNDPGIAVKASDPSLLAYTSGTTGRPKGVVLSAEAIRSSFLSAAQEPAMRWTSADTVLVSMPNFHLGGSYVALQALYNGGRASIIPSFEPVLALERVALDGVTVLPLVPAPCR